MNSSPVDGSLSQDKYIAFKKSDTLEFKSVENFNPEEQDRVMSSEATYQSCGIPDYILDGIHPKNTTQPDEKISENIVRNEEDQFGIPDDILDGIHPDIQTDEN